jgi:alanine-synthesizing transaminase
LRVLGRRHAHIGRHRGSPSPAILRNGSGDAAALNGPQDCVDEVRERYKRRRDVLVEALHHAGWEIPTPEASMFAWAPIPEDYRGVGTMEFSKLLLERANVAVAPGVGFGEYGEGFVRIALVENTQRLRQAARNIKAFLSGRNELPALRRGVA